MEHVIELKALIGSLVYSLVGIILLMITFWIFEKLTPENLWKEIIEKQNKALAIIAAAFILAISIIVASAIH